jgi:hypothetical protein
LTCFVCQRRFRSEYALPDLLQSCCATCAEIIRYFVGEFAVSVDERAFDLDPRHRCRQIPRKFLGRGLQLLPECWQGRFRCIGKFCDRCAQGNHTVPGCGDDGAHGNAAQAALECFEIDAYATFFGSIGHRQRNQQRQSEFHELLHQVQALVEMCGINDRDDPGRSLHIGHAPHDDVAGDAFLERMRAQCEHAGEIDQFECRVIEPQGADMLFDRNAGVVAGLLAKTGQAIEQRALAGIRVADDRDAGRGMPAY